MYSATNWVLFYDQRQLLHEHFKVNRIYSDGCEKLFDRSEKYIKMITVKVKLKRIICDKHFVLKVP